MPNVPLWWGGICDWRHPDRMIAYVIAVAREAYLASRDTMSSRSKKVFGHCLNFVERKCARLASGALKGHSWAKREQDINEITGALVDICADIDLLQFASNDDRPPQPHTVRSMKGMIERAYARLQSRVRAVLGVKAAVIETRWRLKDWLWERGKGVDPKLKAAVEACVVAGEISAARQLVDHLQQGVA